MAKNKPPRDEYEYDARPSWFSRIFWWLFAAGFWGWVAYEFWQGSTQDRRWIAAAAALGFGVQYIANKIDRLERRSGSAVMRRLDQVERAVGLLRLEIEMDRPPAPRAVDKTSPPKTAAK
ncbi:hypothetical protein [Roseiterribacter gracilis]|uniref:Uncharacterized protein n=1 Tax=Roseiterribacter gracilis TaxID=2812848 RepID=A0A8S8XAD5_9PROT|nr:hypothetical protein TMPK1_08060 [Rhodospirillales bacterium TMPK1]